VSCIESGFLTEDVTSDISAKQIEHRHVAWPNYSFEIDVPAVDKLAKEMAEAIVHKGARVAVHCWGGVGRTGTFIIMVMRHMGIVYNDASEYVNKLRMIGPPDTIDARDQYDGLVHFLRGANDTTPYDQLLYGAPVQAMRQRKVYRKAWTANVEKSKQPWYVTVHNDTPRVRTTTQSEEGKAAPERPHRKERIGRPVHTTGSIKRIVGLTGIVDAIAHADPRGFFYFDFDNVLYPSTQQVVHTINNIPRERKFIVTARSRSDKLDELRQLLVNSGYTDFDTSNVISAGYNKEEALFRQHQATVCQRCMAPMYFFDDNIYNAVSVYGKAAGSTLFEFPRIKEYHQRLHVYWVDHSETHATWRRAMETHADIMDKNADAMQAYTTSSQKYTHAKQLYTNAIRSDDFPFLSNDEGTHLVWKDAFDEAVDLKMVTKSYIQQNMSLYYNR
jgi:hypothetical protein